MKKIIFISALLITSQALANHDEHSIASDLVKQRVQPTLAIPQYLGVNSDGTIVDGNSGDPPQPAIITVYSPSGSLLYPTELANQINDTVIVPNTTITFGDIFNTTIIPSNNPVHNFSMQIDSLKVNNFQNFATFSLTVTDIENDSSLPASTTIAGLNYGACASSKFHGSDGKKYASSSACVIGYYNSNQALADASAWCEAANKDGLSCHGEQKQSNQPKTVLISVYTGGLNDYPAAAAVGCPHAYQGYTSVKGDDTIADAQADGVHHLDKGYCNSRKIVDFSSAYCSPSDKTCQLYDNNTVAIPEEDGAISCYSTDPGDSNDVTCDSYVYTATPPSSHSSRKSSH